MALQNTADNLQAQITTKNALIAQLENEKALLEASLISSEGDIESLNLQITSLNAQIANLTNEKNALQTQLNNITMPDITLSISDNMLTIQNDEFLADYYFIRIYQNDNGVLTDITGANLLNNAEDNFNLLDLISIEGEYLVEVTLFKLNYLPKVLNISYNYEITAQQITTDELDSLDDGTLVILTGAIVEGFNNSTTVYLKDSVGAITVYDVDYDFSTLLQIGDEVEIAGTKATYYGVAEIINVTSIEVVSQNNIVSPVNLTNESISDYKSHLVTITATFSSYNDISTSSIFLNVVYNSSSLQVYMYDRADIGALLTSLGITLVNGNSISITGVVDMLGNRIHIQDIDTFSVIS